MPLQPANSPEIFDFGESVTLCLRTRQLCRAGHPLKLERIPLEILIILAERSGDVVSREEIVERIWGNNVFLDTDNSIRGAIRKIRQALNDSPEQPRFIQTVTGKGYRLIPPPPESSGIQNSLGPEQPGESSVSPLPHEDAVKKKWPHVSRQLFSAALIVFLLAAAAVMTWSRLENRPKPSLNRLMIAVLPFENFTGDSEQEYLADGFTEELITQLGRLDSRQVGVIARTSVMPYKGSRKPLPDIGRDLGVQYVLEGSIRRDAGRVRISAQLIRVDDQTQIWAQEYDRELQGLLQLQGEIAENIAAEIEVALGSHPNHPLSASNRPVANYAAYDYYLKGRFYWNKRTPQDFKEAVALFQQAIRQDPTYARAYAGLADSYAMISVYGLAPPDEYMPKARAAALSALQIDGSLAEAHTTLALIAEDYNWDWQTAEKEFRRAIELDPNYATAHHWYAECLAFQGRFDEALAESEIARQLDPLSLIIASDNGAILYFAHHYDRAIERFRTVLDSDPSVGRAYLIIGAYIEQGRTKEALAEIEKWRRREDGPWTWGWEAVSYARAGEMRRAERALQKLQDTSRAAHMDPTPSLAHVYASMGKKDKALFYLEKGYREHSNLMTAMKVDPVFAPLQSDPRFQYLLQRVGLESVPQSR